MLFNEIFLLACLIFCMAREISSSAVCTLSSSVSTCKSSDIVTMNTDVGFSDKVGKGISAGVSITNSPGCSWTHLHPVMYEISTPTSFQYSTYPMKETPKGCNTHYSFDAANTTFFASDFLPLNTEKVEVFSTLSAESLEEGCEMKVSMIFLWIEHVPDACIVV